jgi:hypothetical protein
VGNSLHYVNIKNKRDLRLFLWYLSARDIAILINTLASVKSTYSEDDIFGNNVEIASGAINQALLLIKDKAVKGFTPHHLTSLNRFSYPLLSFRG